MSEFEPQRAKHMRVRALATVAFGAVSTLGWFLVFGSPGDA